MTSVAGRKHRPSSPLKYAPARSLFHKRSLRRITRLIPQMQMYHDCTGHGSTYTMVGPGRSVIRDK